MNTARGIGGKSGGSGTGYNVAAPDRARGRPVSVSIYENEIPPFAEKELERLYENVYCTLARFNIYGAAGNASTYVMRTGEDVAAVLLFHEERGEIKVLNQQIAIDAAHILKFVETVFARYRSAKTVSFYAINTHIPRLPFPFHKFKSLEENVLTLPASPEDYMASLGANSRKNLRSGERKLKKQFPSFRYDILPGPEVPEQSIREIIMLTGERMAARQKKAYVDDESTESIIRLVRTYGLVGVATIDGKICGGNIWYRVGARYFMHIISHDPQYDRYMLGNQIIYMAFCDCIVRGGRECWLMGGGGTYKSRFLAFPLYLDSVVIYRSRVQFLLNFSAVWARAFRLVPRLARQKVIQLAQGQTLVSRGAACSLTLARMIKRFALSGAGSRQ